MFPLVPSELLLSVNENKINKNSPQENDGKGKRTGWFHFLVRFLIKTFSLIAL